MSKVLAIARKELMTLFSSPVAYIVLILAMGVFNIFFYMIVDGNREATLHDIFSIMEFIFVFLMPILTMKIFAEEKQNGTMEFLMTTPTTNSQIVLGKYFGYLVFFSFLIFLTGIYYVILEGFAQPDRWTILIGYLGIWLEGAFFLAVGMLISSWTRHQMVAAMGAYIFLFMLYFSISFIQYCSGSLQTIVRFLSTWSHLENFSSGLFTSADVIYYLSGIGLCLALTRLSIENRLWR